MVSCARVTGLRKQGGGRPIWTRSRIPAARTCYSNRHRIDFYDDVLPTRVACIYVYHLPVWVEHRASNLHFIGSLEPVAVCAVSPPLKRYSRSFKSTPLTRPATFARARTIVLSFWVVVRT